MAYTKYFDNCKAVFQGGGCKAIAYIGAYEEAYARGVFFSELAGTSAGAIIAAFIAAGATPKKLIEIPSGKHICQTVFIGILLKKRKR